MSAENICNISPLYKMLALVGAFGKLLAVHRWLCAVLCNMLNVIQYAMC